MNGRSACTIIGPRTFWSLDWIFPTAEMWKYISTRAALGLRTNDLFHKCRLCLIWKDARERCSARGNLKYFLSIKPLTREIPLYCIPKWPTCTHIHIDAFNSRESGFFQLGRRAFKRNSFQLTENCVPLLYFLNWFINISESWTTSM